MYKDIDGKTCFKCNEYKSYSEYYKHKEMEDGFLNKCKSCAKKDTIENRNLKIDYYREYDKQRAYNPNRVLNREIYAQTEAGKESVKKSRQKWLASNLIKRAASQIVNNAVKNGKLEKKYFCECCKVKDVRIHGHHDDYAYPLSVRWLCPKCHTKWHKENGSGLNG